MRKRIKEVRKRITIEMITEWETSLNEANDHRVLQEKLTPLPGVPIGWVAETLHGTNSQAARQKVSKMMWRRGVMPHRIIGTFQSGREMPIPHYPIEELKKKFGFV